MPFFHTFHEISMSDREIYNSRWWASYEFACSHGIFSSPFSSGGFILWLIGLVDVSDLWNQRIVWVGITQQGADGEQDLGDGKSW